MKLRLALVAMTAVAVVSDSMLMPFYPQFFAGAFGITAPEHVGYYVAAAAFTVMLAFPFWAAVARRGSTLQLLVYTQLAAGAMGLACTWAPSLGIFWLAALAMVFFKGSYLLIYPYLLSLEEGGQHGGTIGLLSVVVHLGGIAGALLGGTVLQLAEPRFAFLAMAAGDLLQTAVCFAATWRPTSLRRPGQDPPAHARVGGPPPSPAPASGPTAPRAAGGLPAGFLLKVGLLNLLFYFSAFLVRPFFSRYWESISGLRSEVVSGLVFAVPGLVALCALLFDKRARQGSARDGLVGANLLGALGLLLHTAGSPALLIAGACLFGWAMFQLTVRLDLLLFELSTPASYATDFSKLFFFQNFGTLLASSASGMLVVRFGLRVPFLAAALGLLATAAFFLLAFRAPARAHREDMVTS